MNMCMIPQSASEIMILSSESNQRKLMQSVYSGDYVKFGLPPIVWAALALYAALIPTIFWHLVLPSSTNTLFSHTRRIFLAKSRDLGTNGTPPRVEAVFEAIYFEQVFRTILNGY
ncbi:Hypothetical_protein [Hexamita inflata]|uniref:Hypothetical_protein n=1 Tax=Hexamita inflata TaxID=28002 RepID=A0ABP1HGF1_9EUKA